MSALQPDGAPRGEFETRAQEVQHALGYTFLHREHLESALRMTDPASSKLIALHPMECAGCGFIELTIGRRVFDQYAKDPEQDLRRTFEFSVNRHVLKRIGDGLELHRYISPRPSPPPGPEWGSTRNNQLVCILVEAVRRDGGSVEAEALVKRLFASVELAASAGEASRRDEPGPSRRKHPEGVHSVREVFRRFLIAPFLLRSDTEGMQAISPSDKGYLRMLGEQAFRLAHAVRTAPPSTEITRVSQLGHDVRNLAPVELLRREAAGAWLAHAQRSNVVPQHASCLFVGLGVLLVTEGLDEALAAANLLWSAPVPRQRAAPKPPAAPLASASFTLDPCVALEARLEGFVVGRISYTVSHLPPQAAEKRGASHLCEIWISSRKCGFGQGQSDQAARQAAAQDVIRKMEAHQLSFRLR